MREKESLSSLLRLDMNRSHEGTVFGGPIYEEVKERSQRPDLEGEEKKERRILSLLQRRAPMLALSLGSLLIGCTRQAPASYPEERPPVSAPGSEELPICPPVPEGCVVINEDTYDFREESFKDYQPGTRICYHGPSIDDPEVYLVDIWTVGNQDEFSNCLLTCDRPLNDEEIDEICDEDEKFSPIPTPNPLPSGLLEVSFTGDK